MEDAWRLTEKRLVQNQHWRSTGDRGTQLQWGTFFIGTFLFSYISNHFCPCFVLMPCENVNGELQWENGRPVIDEWKFGFHKHLINNVKRYVCSVRGCKAYLKLDQSRVVIDKKLSHNHNYVPRTKRTRRVSPLYDCRTQRVSTLAWSACVSLLICLWFSYDFALLFLLLYFHPYVWHPSIYLKTEICVSV